MKPMTKLYQEADANPATLRGRTVAVLGYGIQGRAQALNLRDSGLDIVVGLRPGGDSWRQATQDRVKVASIADAVRHAHVVMMLLPDEVQPEVYERDVSPHLRPGACLAFAHGFNIRFGTIQPPAHADVVLLAPKAPGAAVRENYLKGSGVPALFAVHQDATGTARATVLALTRGIGSLRVGAIETTFAEETETDLFGEQADLCGGVAELIQVSFDTLSEAGYQPELAYFEVLHELKMIVDLIQAGGLEHMWANVSNTAEYGGRTRGPRIVDERVRAAMRQLLAEIQNGTFAREWREEYAKGMPALEKARRDGPNSPLEQVGRRVRELFPPTRPPTVAAGAWYLG